MTTNDDTVRVGIAGLGRSGWNIHARTLQQLPEQFRIVAVMDVDTDRRKEAEADFGCRSYGSFDGLVKDRELALLVIATPNRLHTDHALQALEAGKHVVCEKPLALSSADADRMIARSEETAKVLAPFQNRRYEAHFQKVKEITGSGLLGRIVQIRLAWHGFARRWDWQTLKEFGGGLLNNNGPHILDHALALFGPSAPEIFVDMQNALSSGDAEDHVKIVLKAQGAPTIDVELSSACAYPQDRWLVMGTAGGLTGTTSRLRWKWVDWSRMPERPVEQGPTPDRGYNRETLDWLEDSWEDKNDGLPGERYFYQDLYATLRQGKPLIITPESVRRQIAVIEACLERSSG